MSARVLVVDDQEANVRLLEAKLKAEYFEVVTAYDGPSAIEKAREEQPDVILLDVMMPGMDGFEVCRRLKSDKRTRHIPVIHVTALDQPEDRVRGLDSGADDFLTKPVDNLPLFARLRSLLRLKELLDELRLREERAEERGVSLSENLNDLVDDARILLASGEERVAQHIARKLPDNLFVDVELSPERAVELSSQGYDLILVDLTAKGYDALRICARIRSNNETRNVPILAIVDPDEMSRSVRALDLGVNDIVNRPIDSGELNARIRTQLRRKRYADTLRERLEDSLEMAVIDPLTGLNNRRYLSSRLQQASELVASGEMAASVVIADLDHFKRVNDTYGHDAGDAVLVEFAERVRKQLRAIDLAARFGGEEFVVLMPEASLADARIGAERLRNAIAEQPFRLPGDAGVLNVTVSIGVAQIAPGEDGDSVLRRADEALYRAKASGRNRVVADEAAQAA
ncbi:PleD family two-component system response regulator [Hyphobacterium sp. HN65]|uniref:diguanylate cyclase n=1 Tax=Hyphobacterium lacteum TaxID=3116575 RepID=A0ABU7LMN1_9PROT|nr:PleD family two-component system response regulator [Hyphobacterium sp. HN65]MEE2525132.1 PleD family two-component system response regulator [Hyphobacterium sp. HN65]